VRMLGENDDEEDRPLAPSEAARSFSHLPPFKRIIIVAAGPFFNIFLAFLIFTLFYSFAGLDVLVPEVGEVRTDSPAARAGFRPGDTVRAIDGHPVETWTDLQALVQDSPDHILTFSVERDGETLHLRVQPEVKTVQNLFGEETPAPLIGIVAAGKFKTIELGGLQAFRQGYDRTAELIGLTCLTVVKLIQRVIPITTVGGPILIGQMTGQIAKEGFIYLLPFMAVISVNLGILNLFPIPILDGGVILLLLVEWVTGRPLSLRKRELAQKVGLLFLLLLMVLVFYNDIGRLLN